jgi:hypothetical protein
MEHFVFVKIDLESRPDGVGTLIFNGFLVSADPFDGDIRMGVALIQLISTEVPDSFAVKWIQSLSATSAPLNQ